MTKEELEKKIDELTKSLYKYPKFDDEDELKELQEQKTWNPIKKLQANKRIKELTEKIEAEKAELLEQRKKEISSLKKQIAKIELEEERLKQKAIRDAEAAAKAEKRAAYFKEHKKVIIPTAITAVVLLVSLIIYGSIRTNLQDLNFNLDVIETNVGDNIDLSYSFKPADLNSAKVSKITVSIGNEELVEQQESGYKALKEGSTYAILKYNGKEYDKIDIQINEVKAESISCADEEIGIGRTLELVPTFYPANTTYQEYTLKSDNNDIVKVDGHNIVGVAEGQATITITSSNGKTCDVSIKVVPVIAESLTINGSKTITRLESGQYTVTFNPEDTTDKNVMWSLSDDSYGEINDGEFAASKTGSVDIIAKNETSGKEASITITIKPILVSSFDIKEEEIEITEGNSKRIECSNILPDNADNKGITYTSEDDDVATVSKEGLVTGVKKGTTKINVKSTDSNCSKIVIVKVVTKAAASSTTSNGTSSSSTSTTTPNANATVYVSKQNVFHIKSNCSNMKNYTEMTLSEALAQGASSCSKCNSQTLLH